MWYEIGTEVRFADKSLIQPKEANSSQSFGIFNTGKINLVQLKLREEFDKNI